MSIDTTILYLAFLLNVYYDDNRGRKHMAFRYDRLVSLRKEKGYKQYSLAKDLNISRSALAMWEIGRAEPTNDMLPILANLLGCSVGYLLGTEDEINAKQQFDDLRAEFLAYGNDKIDKLLANTPTFPSNARPVSALHHQRVPLIGSAAAGEPIFDPEDLGVYVESPVECDAAITVKGDSMEPTYKDGDLVYVKCVPDVPEGAVAVVFLDDEATIKHVYKRPTGLTLIGDNRASPPIMAEFEDYANVRIFGVPVGYTRIYKSKAKIKKGF